MKKCLFIYAFIAFYLVGGGLMYTTAQENTTAKEKKTSKFGSFLKKVGETATGINMTDEQFIVNPISSRFKVEIVDCIGNSAEQKFEVLLKIINTGINESNICIGGSCGGNSLAVDKDGNSYKPNACAGDCKDFPTNVPVKVKVTFEKVLPDVKNLEVVKLNIGNFGVVELRNLMLNWDSAQKEVAPSDATGTSQGTLVNSLASKYDVEIVGCMGDLAKQRVEITLKVKNKATNERICIGSSCSGGSMAVDADGNSYKTESCAGDCKDLPTGIFVKAIVGFTEILPSVKSFDYIKLNIGNGTIEIRNIAIDWK